MRIGYSRQVGGSVGIVFALFLLSLVPLSIVSFLRHVGQGVYMLVTGAEFTNSDVVLYIIGTLLAPIGTVHGFGLLFGIW